MKQLISILVLSIFTTEAVHAGRYIASAGIPVENQFIVVLKDEIPSVQAREALLLNLASRHKAKLARTYHSALNGGVLQMTEARAKALSKHAFVDYVEQDSMVQLIVPLTASGQESPPSWGLDRIDQTSLPLDGLFRYSNDGSGVTAYIIDIGILTTHSEFNNERASIGYDAVSDGRNGVDCNGHGTHVAGTVGGMNYGVAKSVNLVAVRVLNCSGSGTISGVISGVDWVTHNHNHNQKPSVANMSLGGGASTALDTAVSNSIKSGITYVIAAGNSGQNACNFSPARVAAAITVGATDAKDIRPKWSNFGQCLDLFSPGVSITSSWIGSDTRTNTISGTSMAAPHVTGVVALILQNTAPDSVIETLMDNSTNNAVKSPGGRSPNRLLFTDY